MMDIWSFCQFDPQDVEDEVDQVRAQAKGQEIDEAKVRDSIEARLEKNMVRYGISWSTCWLCASGDHCYGGSQCLKESCPFWGNQGGTACPCMLNYVLVCHSPWYQNQMARLINNVRKYFV